jgi:tubulin polyglutamylase TTLL6/13
MADEIAAALKKRRPKKKKKKPLVYINLSNCKYEVVYDVSEELGWKVVDDDDDFDDWNVYWTDTSVSTERVMKMQKFQKINHFPGMYQIARKAELARNLTR